MNTQQMRKKVSDAYDSDTWKSKVKNMGDTQVTALYFAFLKRGKFERKSINQTTRQMTVLEYIELKEKENENE